MALIIITGPTAAGKTRLTTALKRIGIPPLVSCTTRPRRNGETQTVDYFFLSKSEFAAERLVETAEYGGHWYGLAEHEVSRALDMTCCVVVEPEGRQQLLEWCEQFKVSTITVFVSAPFETLVRRLLDRNTENTLDRIRSLLDEIHWHFMAGYDVLDQQHCREPDTQRLVQQISKLVMLTQQ